MSERLLVDGRELEITNPAILLWPQAGITKMDFIRYLLLVAPHLVPYTTDRLLMIWCYPNGIDRKRIEKRSRPPSAPSWLPGCLYKSKHRMFLNDKQTLIWLANYGAIEFHVPFDRYIKTNYPTELVFDLDPSDPDDFDSALEVALTLHQCVGNLGLVSYPKTSGATGLQIYVPIESRYTFEETRLVNQFIAKYMLDQMPHRITLDRIELFHEEGINCTSTIYNFGKEEQWLHRIR